MKIVVFGMGKFYEDNKYALNECDASYDIKIVGYIDNDKNKVGRVIGDYEILSVNQVKNLAYDKIVIMSSFANEMEEQLLELGIEEEKIYKFSHNEELYAKRNRIANHFLRGNGIEIGAASHPVMIQDEYTKIKYVDYLSREDFIKTYGSQVYKTAELVNVDIIDDGSQLNTIENGSLSFIISNHMLEHCQNPIGTIETFIKKLKLNGRLLLTIPDKRYTFDKDRELTSFDELKRDYEDEGRNSHKQHMLDIIMHIDKIVDKDEVEKRADQMKNTQDTHFHVWNMVSFIDFLIKVNGFLGDKFEILCIEKGIAEVICVLQRIK